MSKRPISVTFSPPVRTILVTGGAGFVGSAVCRLLVRDGSVRVVNLDTLAGAAPVAALESADQAANYRFVQADIADRAAVAQLLREEHVDTIVHLAAATTLETSVEGPTRLMDTNVMGTLDLMEVALEHWRGLLLDRRDRFRFHHVSTIDVFGDLGFDGAWADEQSRYSPSSPFAVSKAASDHLVRAWHQTFGLPVLLSHSSANYGPFQPPQALVPETIHNAFSGLPIPIRGAGAHVRDWIHVDDHAEALRAVLERGQVGDSYCIGAREEHSTIAIVAMICDLIDLIEPRADRRRRRSLMTFVPDVAGHDRRHAVDPSHIERSLGWRAQVKLRDGLIELIDSYRRERTVAATRGAKSSASGRT